MHPSAQSKTNEVREVLWKEVLGGKLLIASSKFRVKHLGKAPNSPLARVPKFDAHGVERATGLGASFGAILSDGKPALTRGRVVHQLAPSYSLLSNML